MSDVYFRYYDFFKRIVEVGWGGGYVVELAAHTGRHADSNTVELGDPSTPVVTFPSGHSFSGAGTAYLSQPAGAPPSVYDGITIENFKLVVPPSAKDYIIVARTESIVNIGGGGDGGDEDFTFATRDVSAFFFVSHWLTSLGLPPEARPTEIEFFAFAPGMERFPSDGGIPPNYRGFTVGRVAAAVYKSGTKIFDELVDNTERNEPLPNTELKFKINLTTGNVSLST